MFSEVLRIKPVIDTPAARRMETQLNTRFATVATRFGQGLKTFLKGGLIGAVAGAGLGLLEKLLNPVKKLEERMTKLLDEGQDLKELAETFGTTPGRIKQIELAAQGLGVKPDQLKVLMTKFGDAVETARKELAAGGELSDTSRVVRNFTGGNVAENFVEFLAGLKAVAPNVRQNGEESVFGQRLRGSSRLLVDRDFAAAISSFGSPTAFDPSAEKLGRLAETRARIQAANEANNFRMGAANASETGLVRALGREAREQQRTNTQLGDMAAWEKLAAFADKFDAVGDFIRDKIVSLVALDERAAVQRKQHIEETKKATKLLEDMKDRGMKLGPEF